MRVLVCGGRDFGDLSFKTLGFSVYKKHAEMLERQYYFVIRMLYKTLHIPPPTGDEPNDSWLPPNDLFIIAGVARGVDSIAIDWAVVNWVAFKEYPADWKKFGKKAGYLRNVQMLEEGKPDMVLAFPGGNGTKMMVDLATKKGVKVIKIEYEDIIS